MTHEEIEARKIVLERKLAARTNKAGYAGNCAALQAEIARLMEELNAPAQE